MKRRNEKSLIPLFKLYSGYYFQKSSIIVIVISLILMIGTIYLFTYIDYDKEIYITNYSDIHQWFLSKSMLVISIFNLVIISSISIITNISSRDFDKLFLSSTKRSKILASKMLVCLILFLILAIIEFFSIIAVAYLRYSLFKINYEDIIGLLYLYISILFDLSISFICSEIIESIFTPFLVLFISIIIKVFINDITSLSDKLKNYIPILEIGKEIYFNMSSLYISILWIALLLIVYFIIYSLKDLK